MTAGCFVVGTGLATLAGLAGSGSRQQLESRLQHELRAGVNLMARELRRAGHWASALQATQPASPGQGSPTNPHDAITALSSSDGGAGHILYSRSSDGATSGTAGAAPAQSEQWGFRVHAGTLQMLLGAGNWQPLTDPNLVRVTQLQISSRTDTTRLADVCATACCEAGDPEGCVPNVSTPPGCPRLMVRSYALLLVGQATPDSRIQRALREQVRVRNDVSSGACPP